jgi:hypothetical protein
VGVPVDDRVTLLSLVLASPGDANADGLVDRFDFATVLDHYGAFGGWEQGDFDLDGRVGFADFQLWQMNYGRALTAGQLEAMTATGVPEPGVGAIIVGALMVVARRRSRSPSGRG